jgi:ATPase subunit of ABC transporter with duplicated ATPase domains
MSSLLTAQGLAFELPDGREIFKDLNFSLSYGLSALVGPNGAGKTCLARILAGESAPTRGSVFRVTSVSLFAQSRRPPTKSVAEFLGPEFSWPTEALSLLARIPPESLCSQLSGGQWTRVRLAQCLHAGFVILDEPTNNLDAEGREAVKEFLSHHRGGALLISHDRECLALCREIYELSSRGLQKFGDGWPAYLFNKERERERLEAHLYKAKRQRDDVQLESVRQKEQQERKNQRGKARARGGGQAKLLLNRRKGKAEATTGKIDRAGIERANEAVREVAEALDEVKLNPVMYADLMGQEIPSQKIIAEAKDFNIRFKDWLYPEDLNFSWKGNLRISLDGPNGSGKSTLLKAVAGEQFLSRGSLIRGNLNVLMIDQNLSSLDENLSIFDNVRANSVLSESEIRSGLAKFLFTKEGVFQSVKTLSGGEKLRAALAQGFLGENKPEVLIMDEPTNNLDMANVRFLEELLRNFKGALILVSHDPVFLRNCGVELKK